LRRVRGDVALTWSVIGLGCWIGYQLILQNGRLLLRVEALEKRLEQLGAPREAEVPSMTGLPIGTVAVDFELPDLSGRPVTLSQWGGRRVLLIFFDPACRFCRQMLPELAALPAHPSEGLPVALVLTTGGPAENRKLFGEYGVRVPVLLQEAREVAGLYRTDGTPTGYLIDEDGTLASEIVVGADALLALATASPDGEGQTRRAAGATPSAPMASRSLSESRINRNGLPAGTRAPAFRLPRIEGGELSLEGYRGQRVLLVFSDPACGPCDELMPKLERLHRQSLDLEVLMISRRDREANQAKVAERGVTFPVVLQQHWEISRDYGMFATPIGYLIDEQGIIAKDVAVGAEAILALVGDASRPDQGKEAVKR
jgi:peroxiredoxin